MTAAALAPLLTQISQISVVVKDIPRATAFYRDALGLPFLFEAPGLAFFQCGGVRLMLGGAELPEFNHPASVLYFDVADIEAAHETLAARGVHFRDAPHVVHRANDRALWMAFFDDGEGNVFAISAWRVAA
jgi:catechol 2,3-dioxygenase-like lactoylglutathione lyase family enzyme